MLGLVVALTIAMFSYKALQDLTCVNFGVSRILLVGSFTIIGMCMWHLP